MANDFDALREAMESTPEWKAYDYRRDHPTEEGQKEYDEWARKYGPGTKNEYLYVQPHPARKELEALELIPEWIAYQEAWWGRVNKVVE